MLSSGAVDRILWIGVLCLVAWYVHHVTILLIAPQLSICQKALRTLLEDGNVIPKHVGAIIHN
jgi:hypothetical protein